MSCLFLGQGEGWAGRVHGKRSPRAMRRAGGSHRSATRFRMDGRVDPWTPGVTDDRAGRAFIVSVLENMTYEISCVNRPLGGGPRPRGAHVGSPTGRTLEPGGPWS